MWEKLDTRLKVLLGVCALIAIVSGWYSTFFGNPFAKNAQSVLAQEQPRSIALHQIASCERAHRLSAQNVKTYGKLDQHILFQRCDWPQPPGASVDGYTRITDSVRWVSGRAAAQAWSEVETFTAPCDALTLTYVLDHMGGYAFGTVALRRGRLIMVTTALRNHRIGVTAVPLAEAPIDANLPLPTAGGFHVLRSGHVEIFDARCSA